jgi:hypothetical protein
MFLVCPCHHVGRRRVAELNQAVFDVIMLLAGSDVAPSCRIGGCLIHFALNEIIPFMRFDPTATEQGITHRPFFPGRDAEATAETTTKLSSAKSLKLSNKHAASDSHSFLQAFPAEVTSTRRLFKERSRGQRQRVYRRSSFTYKTQVQKNIFLLYSTLKNSLLYSTIYFTVTIQLYISPLNQLWYILYISVTQQ